MKSGGGKNKILKIIRSLCLVNEIFCWSYIFGSFPVSAYSAVSCVSSLST